MPLQVVAATGQVLLHRLFCKQSMTDFDVKVQPPPLHVPHITAGPRPFLLFTTGSNDWTVRLCQGQTHSEPQYTL